MAIKNEKTLARAFQLRSNALQEIANYELSRDEEIAAIQERFKKETAQLKKTVEKQESDILEYAENNKNTLFENSKTYKTAFGEISLRSSTSLEFLPGKTEKEIIDYLKLNEAPWASQVIKIKESLDKTGLKNRASSGELKPDRLEKIGVALVTKEALSVK